MQELSRTLPLLGKSFGARPSNRSSIMRRTVHDENELFRNSVAEEIHSEMECIQKAVYVASLYGLLDGRTIMFVYNVAGCNFETSDGKRRPKTKTVSRHDDLPQPGRIASSIQICITNKDPPQPTRERFPRDFEGPTGMMPKFQGFHQNSFVKNKTTHESREDWKLVPTF
mmetsp:Transcript_23822/g.56317  ORF Transcript_23822/g.56317 Transcript_23822/m.56317 type:complete len:170 (+) Transcript_23822:1872-2381(+)